MKNNLQGYVSAAIIVCQAFIEEVPETSRCNDAYAALEELLNLIKVEKSPVKLRGLLTVGVGIASTIGEFEGIGVNAISLEGVLRRGLSLLGEKKSR
jgi:hypothetical protein